MLTWLFLLHFYLDRMEELTRNLMGPAGRPGIVGRSGPRGAVGPQGLQGLHFALVSLLFKACSPICWRKLLLGSLCLDHTQFPSHPQIIYQIS